MDVAARPMGAPRLGGAIPPHGLQPTGRRPGTPQADHVDAARHPGTLVPTARLPGRHRTRRLHRPARRRSADHRTGRRHAALGRAADRRRGSVMSDTAAGRDLFMVYAATCLTAAALAVVIAFQISDLPDLDIAIYLGIGVALWCLNLALTGVIRQQNHGLARLVLLAAFALVWPLVIAALVGYLGWDAVRAARQ